MLIIFKEMETDSDFGSVTATGSSDDDASAPSSFSAKSFLAEESQQNNK